MELNRLKDILDKNIREQEYSIEDFRNFLARRAQGTIDRLMKAILTEMVIFLVAIAAMLYLIVFSHITLPPSMKLIAIIALAFFFILYISLYFHIKHSNPLEQSIREALERTIRVLKHFINLYVYGTTALIILGYILSVNYAFKAIYSQYDSIIPLALCCILPGIILGVLSWWFMRWYAGKMFGKPLQSLKNDLADLQEAENT